jgi:hypothetical protein
MMFARTGSGHRRCSAIACSAPCLSLLVLLIPCSRPLLLPVLVPVISAGLFSFLALFQRLAAFARAIPPAFAGICRPGRDLRWLRANVAERTRQ